MSSIAEFGLRIADWLLPVALRVSAGIPSHWHSGLSRSFRSGLHWDLVALRGSAGTFVRTLAVTLSLFLSLAILSPTHAAPGDDLRARIGAAAPGDTIEVEPGVHNGPFVIEKPLRLIGQPGAILQGDRLTHVVAIRAPDVEISGFTIRGSGMDLGADHAAIHVSGARAIIRDNRIIESLHGIYVRKADGCRIERNIIRGPGAAADSIADPLTTPLRPLGF